MAKMLKSELNGEQELKNFQNKSKSRPISEVRYVQVFSDEQL